MADGTREGWANPGSDQKWHYFEFVALRPRSMVYSVCRKYAWRGPLPQGDGDNCAVCQRKMAARAKEARP